VPVPCSTPRRKRPGRPKRRPRPLARRNPAEARHAVEAATKLLEAGKSEQAAQALTATLTGGNLPPAILAKAFYVRGLAYRQQGKPAQAISDLTNALWLKGGLGGAERVDALKQRSAAYRDAGLTENGEVVASAPAAKSKSWWGGETASTGASSTGLAGGGWWNNLFGSGSSASASKAPEATASIAKSNPPPAAKIPKVTSSWSSAT
jgi:hypothetical protein